MYPNLDLVQAIIRILLAIVIGGVLGLERESKHRPAGFRTYVIVCLGSTLIALTNVYLFKEGLS
ncbi:MAG: MgtC/SapB family protein, partial [Lachnospiraceae bacterium]|nr:MgtC/SapB family protein [Lachnospiraceae bacterium]